ncbi:MAG: phosphoglycerate dehydrogenase [Actinomycetota bacterium]
MNFKQLDKCKVLVTPTSFSKYDRSLAKKLEDNVGKVIYNTTGKPLKEADLLPIIKDFDGYIAGLDEITSIVIEKAENLKVIARYGTGVDKVDLDAARVRNIYVTITSGANSVSVAELTIGFLISAARNLVFANNETSKGRWPRLKGISLSGKNIGIIGLGSIGKEVALRLKPFKVKIFAYDTDFDIEFAKKNDITYLELDDILKGSDFISLHIPVLPSTIKMVNKEFLSKMKKNSILINTSRGDLVDEEALYESLESGHLRTAAIDTFCSEPDYLKCPLRSLPQLIVTPHIGAATDNASDEMTRISIDECIAVLSGKKPRFAVVDPQFKKLDSS